MKFYLQTFITFAMICCAFHGFSQGSQTFLNSGTWTCPPGVTSITVECWGGGGGGGGTSTNPSYGGGGAGGSYARSVFSVVPGIVYPVTIGVGGITGAGTASGVNGGNGGDTWFNNATAIFAHGGAGGIGGTSTTAAGTGGLGLDTTNIGDVYFSGGNGFAGTPTRSGSGGGSAGSTTNGGDATISGGGTGGVSGGAAGANGSTSAAAGNSGLAPGSGASGGFRTSATTRSGGSGAKGQVKISYICPIATLPYTQQFEDVTPPAIPFCTSIQNAGTGNNWTTVSAPGNNGFLATGGNVLRYADNSTNAANAWWYSQGINLNAGANYFISYKYGNNSNYYHEALSVAYGNAPLNTAMTNPLASYSSIGDGVAHTDVISFTPPSSGIYYFGFNALSIANQFYLYLDSITINIQPTCVAPGTPTITNNMATSVDVSFTASLSVPVNGYDYYYNTTNTTPNASTLPSGNVVSSPASITGLAPATTYYVWIRARCSSTDQSTWTNTVPFTTAATCVAPGAPTIANNTATSVNVIFTASPPIPVNGYDYYYSTTNITPNANTLPSGNVVASPVSITGLSPSTTYYVWVRARCSSTDQSAWTNNIIINTMVINDDAPGAIALTVGAGCTGNPYNNTSATQSASEPFPSCIGSSGNGGMWYKFIAPASGSVKVSCDDNGTMGDSRLALFSASDVNDYSTFNIISCDDDNGIINSTRSLFYTSGLTPNTTYYVLVDLYSASGTRGTYCVTVDELSAGMLATTAGDCINGKGLGANSAYHGWLSLVDANGNLNANVRPLTGTATSFTASRTVKTTAARTDQNGLAYLNRNFLITGSNATSADLQLYFTDAEITNLGATLPSLNVSRVAGTICKANFTGVATVLNQTNNGSANGVNYIQVNTPGFSNFYIMGGTVPLPIVFEYFKGKKEEDGNHINWKVNVTNENEMEIILERSADGRTYEAIQKQTASAARCLDPFSYIDKNFVSGVGYYRLKAINHAGKADISQVVAISNIEKGFDLLNLAPNPVNDISILNIAAAENGNINMLITDITGQVLLKQSISISKGNNALEINSSSLRTGMYQLIVNTDNGYTRTIRFVKK